MALNRTVFGSHLSVSGSDTGRQALGDSSYMRDNEVSATLLIQSNFLGIDERDSQNLRISGLAQGAIIEHNIKIVAGITNIKTSANATRNTCDGQLECARVGLGHQICRDDHVPPPFTARGFQHFQGAVYRRSDAARNDTHMANA